MASFHLPKRFLCAYQYNLWGTPGKKKARVTVVVYGPFAIRSSSMVTCR
jgi:hypothetical protein